MFGLDLNNNSKAQSNSSTLLNSLYSTSSDTCDPKKGEEIKNQKRTANAQMS